MAKKIRKQDEGVGVSLGKIAGSALRGVGALLGFAVNLEKEGKSEYKECGEIKGKTESGKDMRGAYGFHMKVGLNPEDFSARGGSAPGGRDQKKLNSGSDEENSKSK